MNPPVRDEETHDLAVRNSLRYENGTEHIHIGEEPGGTSGRTSPPIVSNVSINPSILVPPDPAVREEKFGERQVAMMEAINGQFKLLMRRFLEVEGIQLISSEGDSWLDVVTNISWEAAELIRPEPSEGKEMDPLSYVKVKCVASGTPRQSVVIKGLAFKKNISHKHMPSSFKNPKLLLLKGVLGHSDSGLSSFDALGEILLRGANSEELKKVKHMLQYTVVAAYHLILETSFFQDQRVFLNDKIVPQVESSAVPHLPSLSNGHTQYNPKPSQNAKELSLLPGFNRMNGSSNMDLYYTSADSAAEFSTRERSTDTDKEVAACKVCEKEGPVSSAEYGGHDSGSSVNKEKMDGNDSESILVLTTSQCIPKQSMCEQSRYYRIKYYGNCDISMGRYLQYLLHSPGYCCSSCDEPPEAHEYSYTHQNGNLTVFVRQLHPDHHLSGESKGNIWMWSHCLKCEGETGIPMATPRVVMSTSARSLSFGKFLELSFSSQSTARRLSKCGHLLHQDCLRFFGWGSKVAVFWYTPVEVFTAFKQPTVFEFNNPNRGGWLEDEFRKVRNSLKCLLACLGSPF
ncbi:1-phosphatidylinositol-3-phosphate 5-kinase FAB1A-like isoform X2 [Carex rostrata]